MDAVGPIVLSSQSVRKFIGKRFDIPAEFLDKTVTAQIFTTSGKLLVKNR